MDLARIEAWVAEKKIEVLKIFEDGFQVWDVFSCLKIVHEGVMAAEELKTNAEKREAANQLAAVILKDTNTPWFPDGVSDPLMEKGFKIAFDWLLPDEADSTVQPE